MAEKLFSQSEIQEMLKPIAEEIVDNVRAVVGAAINMFYADYSPHMYKRAFGFSNLANFWFDDVATPIENGYRLTFRFSADDVAVGSFSIFHHIKGSISGDEVEDVVEGSPEWAFDSGFVHGYHGGPNFPPYHSMGGVWKYIEDYVNSL